MSTGLSDFPTDKEWIDELCRAKSTDSPIIPSQDPNEHRWGFLEPLNSNHPILHLPRDHDKYNIVPEDSSTNLVVVPWRDDHHPWVKVVKIQEDQPSSWVFCIRTLFPNGQPKYRRFRDRDQLQFGDHVFVFNDTITLDGALIKYQHIGGCETVSGSFGFVTKVALRTDPHVQVALKVVKAARPTVGTVEGSKTYEISALRALNHPNVCRLIEIFTTTKGRDLHIVMEFAELPNLAVRLQTHQVFLNQAAPLSGDVFAGSSIFQLCNAVKYIHSQGIMHRDIKPDNLLITSMSPLTLKVADFGEATREARSTKHCGTYPYMAPEVMSQPNYDRRVDIYSVGAVVLDILSAMQNCANPIKAWTDELDGRKPNADDICQLATNRINCLETDQNLQMADPRALTLCKRLLRLEPKSRMTLATALNNGWLREMDSQRYIALHTQSLISTQSADGPTPITHADAALSIHRDLVPATSAEHIHPEVILSVPQEPVEENVRDMVLKRRSVRIGKLARKRVSLHWLYRSGFERDMPVLSEEE